MDPRRIKQLRAFYGVPRLQEVFVLHNECAVVAEVMIQSLQSTEPLFGPLAAAIAPSTRPFGFTPRVADFQEPLALVLHGTEDTVRVRADEAYSSH